MNSYLRFLTCVITAAIPLVAVGCLGENEAASNETEAAADSGPEAFLDEEQSEVTETASKPLFPTTEWMRHIPDSKLLSEFSIPGTHDSLARHDTRPYTGTAQTQLHDIPSQLNDGVRFFDLRFSVIDYPKNPRLRGHHGPIDQGIEAPQVFSQMLQFLKAHPSETVIVSLKEENTSYPYAFEALLGRLVKQNLARWALDTGIPRLGSVRQKLVLVRRFKSSGAWPLPSEGLNAADGWPKRGEVGVFNVEDQFEFQCDWTSCGKTLTDKWSAVKSHLDAAPGHTDHYWYLTFTSATRFPAAQHKVPAINAITDYANYIHPLLRKYLSGKRGSYGVVLMDYEKQNLAQAVISTND